jgi:hypothetical protein
MYTQPQVSVFLISHICKYLPFEWNAFFSPSQEADLESD